MGSVISNYYSNTQNYQMEFNVELKQKQKTKPIISSEMKNQKSYFIARAK